MDEIVGEFLVESYENLDRFDQDLLALEGDPGDTDVLASVFRTIHTVKGTSGFFGFTRLETLTHVAENLLGKLRDGELALTEPIASALLATGDTVRAILGDIEATGDEGDRDVSVLTTRLGELLDPDGAPANDEVTASEDVDPSVTADGGEGPGRLGDLLVDAGAVDRDDVEVAALEQNLGDRRPIGEILVEQHAVATDDVDDALDAQRRAGGRAIADTSIRVDVGLLDQLMNLVGELVLARNQIVQLVTQDQDSSFAGASQRLNLITTELQEGVMKTRMQPIGNVWSKLPRVVRDLSLECGKQIRLEMVGEDTELDKTIIEAIKDPLTHLVRNAVDHGIEDPEARVAAGKAAEGTLRLHAFHEGGQVNIEISDDGGGIDPDAVRAKAVQQGVVTAEQAARMGDREAVHLIFAPGFSTAGQVTNVSGRGVGMDVVRTNIERIGGTVDLATDPGDGTTVKVKIPLTLAIVPALIVSSGGDRYAIPQLSLLELVRLEGDEARTGIELVHGAAVYRLRGRLLPVVDLAGELGRADDGDRAGAINMVVLQADGAQFGLLVDDIHDTQEIVVKPLGSHLKDATLFAGATIMGDGRVSLILDVMAIAQRARVLSEGHDRGVLDGESAAHDPTSRRRTLLVVGVGGERRAAIALSQVERLEEFETTTVERAGGHEVVQYRGDILPLVRLDGALGAGSVADPEQPLNVVVHVVGDQRVGLVVDRILDVVEQDVDVRGADDRAGLLGSAVVQGKITDVLDVQSLVRATDPRFVTDHVIGA